jgi:Flp pilus assembly pilin Flp
VRHGERFLKEEDGATTVDWVVLTAGVTGLGLATMVVVSGGMEDLSGDIAGALSGTGIISEFELNWRETACFHPTLTCHFPARKRPRHGPNLETHG